MCCNECYPSGPGFTKQLLVVVEGLKGISDSAQNGGEIANNSRHDVEDYLFLHIKPCRTGGGVVVNSRLFKRGGEA